MSRIKCALGATLSVYVTVQACSPLPEPPPRPASVPADATRVGSLKLTMWVKCWYKAPTNYCRIYNAAGEPYYDEVFLPYDGGPAIPESELEVDPNLSNPAYIHLKNGRTLLPSTNFERHKALLDRIARSGEKK